MGSSIADYLSKGMVLPLGDNNGKGPALFLDGSKFTNVKASDCCPAWLVTPILPKRKREQERIMRRRRRSKIATAAKKRKP